MDANRVPDGAGSGTDRVRIAIVSTPRSGNSWLRRLLSGMYDLTEVAVHNPSEAVWDDLPTRCVLQLHWHRAEPFLSLLERHGFRVVVLTRHPLDVLISILHFSQHEPQSARWLEGEGGDESSIHGATPVSPAFLDYAAGPRATALLGVSREWWGSPGCHGLRYRDLVADPAGELARLALSIGHPASAEIIARSVAANTIEALRATSRNQHFWRGRPGHWRGFVPASKSRRIAEVHAESFRMFDFVCDPDESLDERMAVENWKRSG